MLIYMFGVDEDRDATNDEAVNDLKTYLAACGIASIDYTVAAEDACVTLWSKSGDVRKAIQEIVDWQAQFNPGSTVKTKELRMFPAYPGVNLKRLMKRRFVITPASMPEAE